MKYRISTGLLQHFVKPQVQAFLPRFYLAALEKKKRLKMILGKEGLELRLPGEEKLYWQISQSTLPAFLCVKIKTLFFSNVHKMAGSGDWE